MTEDQFQSLPDYQRGRLDALQHLLNLVVAAMPESTQVNISDIFSEYASDALEDAETRGSSVALTEAAAAWDTSNALLVAIKKWRRELAD